MGQAKRNGTFEERKAAAIKRIENERIAYRAAHPNSRRAGRSLVPAMMAMAMMAWPAVSNRSRF